MVGQYVSDTIGFSPFLAMVAYKPHLGFGTCGLIAISVPYILTRTSMQVFRAVFGCGTLSTALAPRVSQIGV
jgi:hypothetical protein